MLDNQFKALDSFLHRLEIYLMHSLTKRALVIVMAVALAIALANMPDSATHKLASNNTMVKLGSIGAACLCVFLIFFPRIIKGYNLPSWLILLCGQLVSHQYYLFL
jgi:hypothetical protein